ncbi:hypothetical protein E3N88_12548 [Mikania micrantha]|uniref:Uncharacterized protein n=1 Tax=Mikania micrantha TaxID=192012 RepID=A0A5N6P759_9ASTR|nr:hypothetical protein E3N88_12548 [Mikania micrantha]
MKLIRIAEVGAFSWKLKCSSENGAKSWDVNSLDAFQWCEYMDFLNAISSSKISSKEDKWLWGDGVGVVNFTVKEARRSIELLTLPTDPYVHIWNP